MLLYIHVPFCRSRCNYCAFHSMAIGRDGSGAQMMSDYLDTLLLELAHYGDKLGKAPVSSVFFGGGTPSLLPPDIVGRILERIDRTFQLETKAEISLEANPESLSRSNKAADFLAAGINRLSIGIQSLDDSCLRVLGRPHKVQDSLNAVLAARTAGFTNISVDLMWGLPGQGVRQWLQTLKDVVRLAPEHISSYCLTLEPGTPLELDCDAGRLVLPPERDQNIMFMEGAAFMEKSGYLHYEISNFARMGFQCRHNLGYWEGEDYLGLGPSATSTIAGARWTNPASLAAWGNLAREKSLGKQAEILAPGFMEGAAFMEKSGYLHYEISNFARMGFQCRHNLGYWEGEDYLGLGPSATSTIAGARWTNPASLAAWGNLAREKSLGKQAEILAPGTRLMEHIMLRLRTSRGLRLKAYKQLTGRDFLKDNQRLVQAMHENGLIRIRNGYLSLTRSGMVVSNAIISNIFERVEQTVGARPPRPGQIELPKIESGQMAIAGNARAGNEEIRKIVWPLAEEAQ